MKYFICALMMMPTVVFALSPRQPVPDPDPIVIYYPDGTTYTLREGENIFVSDSNVLFEILEKDEDLFLKSNQVWKYRDFDMDIDEWVPPTFVPIGGE